MKRGFTLVELLATIVILAVVSLITMPIITGVINKTRLNSLKSSAYGLLEASNLYIAQYNPDNTIRFDIDNNKVISNNTTNLLKYKGSIKEGTVILNNKGKVTVCITDGKNSAYKNYNENKVTLVSKNKCTIPDNTSIVYLDNKATLTELSNQELTDIVMQLQDKINNIYPVGSIYISVTDDTVEKVEKRFGGSWERYAEGKTLVGVQENEVAEQTGGHKSINLSTSNIPTLSVTGKTDSTGSGYTLGYGSSNRTTSSDGAHSHSISTNYPVVYNADAGTPLNVYNVDIGWHVFYGKFSATANLNGAHTHTSTDYFVNNISGVEAHKHNLTATYSNDNQTKVNVQDPYITVYMWKRIS